MPKKINRDLPELQYVDDKTLAERIKSFRKQKGYTQFELAEKIGISRDLLSSYELGRIRIYDEMICRLSIALEISTDSLLGMKKTEKF